MCFFSTKIFILLIKLIYCENLFAVIFEGIRTLAKNNFEVEKLNKYHVKLNEKKLLPR